MPTRRTLEDGRLFPPEEFHGGWALSAQADKAGYACRPRARLDALEDYEAVEVMITGPGHWPVDPTTIGLPEDVAAAFLPMSEDGPWIGHEIAPEQLDAVRRALAWAPANPNAGIPRGAIVWGGRSVWHGAGREAARDIEANGIDMGRCSGGYFGYGFYVADDPALARSNHAEFADDDGPGEVVEMSVVEGARILDMRNAEDQREWDASGLPGMLGRPDMPARARRLGIAGIYDRSVGGLAIYDPDALRVVGIVAAPEEPAGPRM